jgi:D-3-phosphoglycerate dehydrogenase / 2-oxoglutarate reductase
MPDVLVTENVSGPGMDALKRSFSVTFEPDLWRSPEKIRQIIGEYRAIVVRNQTQVNAELIEAGRSLLVIGRAGVGLDNVDAEAASEAGVVVAFTPEQNSISVAELAVGMMLSLARMIPAADRSTKSGKWDRQRFVGTELFEKTLGIVGFGRIGFLTAMRARAFGMDVLAHDNFVSPDSPMAVESRARLVGIDELLMKSDFVSCHLPKSPQTLNYFDAGKFAKMKPTAFFINSSRGEVVDEDALLRALRERQIAGAALDVRAKEPAVSGPLYEMDNVLVTPHIAAFTGEGQERVVSSICRDVAAVLAGETAKNFANFPKPRRG